MTSYSVADAKTGLPRLIDKALGGEEVVITRHGKPVAEIRPIAAVDRAAAPATYAWLQARRQARKGVGVTAVELLNQIYDDPER